LADCAWKIDDGKIDLKVIVPANTTASVTLPGADKSLEVGSGSWHWSVPYQDPDARGPYTVDDLVGDIMGDAAARDAIVEVLIGMEVSGFQQMIIFSERNIPLRNGLRTFPNYEEAVTQINDALAGL
jgi:alpha-L-rhamnosidase